MARNFKELQAKMSHKRRVRISEEAQEIIKNLALDELREARNLTQEHLAELLHVNQASISKMERRTDMYISTLSSFVKAMGGELRIEAVFPEGRVNIKQFDQLRKAASAGK